MISSLNNHTYPTAVITGVAGLVGSTLAMRLIKEGWQIVGLDDFSLGTSRHVGEIKTVASSSSRGSFVFLQKDVSTNDWFDATTTELKKLGTKNSDVVVFHLAANSDISLGAKEPEMEFRRTTQTTLKALEFCRLFGLRYFVFSSTSAVYGETAVFPTPEDLGPMKPISLYGAAKLASEAYISAYVENHGLNAWIYRFGNVVGKRLTHGVIYDFVKRLTQDPSQLSVLGNGTQQKTYIHADDCVDGILHGFRNSPAGKSHSERFQVFNLSTNGSTKVSDIAQWCTEEMASANNVAAAKIQYGQSDRGWVGDVPRTSLDVSRMAKLGWNPRFESDASVITAIKEFISWSNNRD
jgi:UDP-glucose 4-epimerase